MTDSAITILNLCKFYGEVNAVDGLTLDIYRGEVFGLLGPNGAGKTTIVEILEGLRKADSGEISMLNYSIPAQINSVKQKLGVQLQTTDLPELIKVEELLHRF